MSRLLVLCTQWLCFIFLTNSALADQLIIEPDMGKAPILQTMQAARQSIHLVMYGFTDTDLLAPLLKQHTQGRSVKIILEGHPYKAADENKKIIHLLKQHDMDWREGVPPYRLVHEKALVIDGKKALVMTFNFTRGTFKNQRNFGLIIDDPHTIKEIEAVFAADWDRKAIDLHQSELVWSPDNSRDKLLTSIQQAQRSINIYMQTLNDYELAGALAKAARRGVHVRVLTSSKLRHKQAAYLERAGVKLRRTQHMIIHAKVFMFDDKSTILGSVNATRASLDNNRELAVISTDPKVMTPLINTFNHDWDAA